MTMEKSIKLKQLIRKAKEKRIIFRIRMSNLADINIRQTSLGAQQRQKDICKKKIIMEEGKLMIQWTISGKVIKKKPTIEDI